MIQSSFMRQSNNSVSIDIIMHSSIIYNHQIHLRYHIFKTKKWMWRNLHRPYARIFIRGYPKNYLISDLNKTCFCNTLWFDNYSLTRHFRPHPLSYIMHLFDKQVILCSVYGNKYSSIKAHLEESNRDLPTSNICFKFEMGIL